MNEKLELIFTRRSSREYTGKPVSTADLMEIIKAGAYAPSAMNQQKWHFTAVRNPKVLEEIRVAIRDSFRDVCKTDPTSDLAIAVEDDYPCFYGAPCLLMVSMPRDNGNIYTDGACALENIFLAAHALGIDSCWINQQRSFCDMPRVRKILDRIGVPSDHVIAGSAALGYAAVKGELKPRAENNFTIVD